VVALAARQFLALAGRQLDAVGLDGVAGGGPRARRRGELDGEAVKVEPVVTSSSRRSPAWRSWTSRR
jgi:hypothetical protein